MRPIVILSLLKGSLAAPFFCCGGSQQNVYEPGMEDENHRKGPIPVQRGPFPLLPLRESKAALPLRESDAFSGYKSSKKTEITDVESLRVADAIDRVHSSSSSSYGSPQLNRFRIGEDLLLKPAILPFKPHDYGVFVTQYDDVFRKLSQLSEFNESILSFPFEEAFVFQENLLPVFKNLFPGLQQVSIAENDVICLILFALIRDRSDRALAASEIESLHHHFDNELLAKFAQSFKEFDGADAALKSLFTTALENDCFYTIEAFTAVNHLVPFEEPEMQSYY
jgi:hypothetical protein